MTTFVLIPGAGGQGAYWDELVRELDERGHRGIGVDIREDDPALGLPEYAAIVDAAIGDERDVVLVAQSLGGFTAPMVSTPVARIVLLNAMIPLPGETPGQWWGATGSNEAWAESEAAAGRDGTFDLETTFLHDVPDEVKARLYAAGNREPADTPFGQPCTFDTWPDVPLHVVAGADDRMFPVGFQQRIAKERLGKEVDVVPGGHLVACSRPGPLADLLLSYLD